MPNYRKKVRDVAVQVLSAASTGFNAQLLSLSPTYSINPFTIEWSLPSNNFIMGFLDPEFVEVSSIVTFPAAVLYGGSSVNEDRAKGLKFSGQVLLGLDFYLRFRAILDRQHVANEYDAESDYDGMADAVEDAALETLHVGRPTFQVNGVILSGYKTDRDSIIAYGDGHSQRVRLTLGFEVHV